jgi:hypothetical protein
MYFESVNATEWWPSHFCTCFAFAPRSNSMLAQVCRNAWKPAQGAPASSAIGRSSRESVFELPKRCAGLRREDKILVARPLAAVAVAAELADQNRVERHVASSVPRLRGTEVTAYQAPPHLHMGPRAVELQVSPLQRDELRPPQACRCKEPEHDSMPRVNGAEDRGELLARKRTHFVLLEIRFGRPVR